jgi:AraC family transcriptional regulator of arabinose operon
MTENQQAAEIQWRLIMAQAVSLDELVFCMSKAIGEHQGSVLHQFSDNHAQDLMQALYQEIEKSDLKRRWSTVFDAKISAEEADRFLLDFHNTVQEGLSSFFSADVVAGITKIKKGAASDINIRRVNTKLGWRLHLTTQGSGDYNCVGRRFISQVCDLVLLSPDALIDYQRHEQSDTWQHQWVYFLPDEACLNYLNWPEVGPNIYSLSLSDKEYEKIESIFNEIVYVYSSGEILAEKLINNLLQQIFIRCGQGPSKKQTKTEDSRINSVKNYMVKNYNQTFALQDLANEVGLSIPRLSSLFKQQEGISIMKWRDQNRMSKAAQLLLQSKEPISQVAFMVGFNDALYFSRTFHQHFDCSPSQYRERK